MSALGVGYEYGVSQLPINPIQLPSEQGGVIERSLAEPLRARDQALEVQNRSLGELIEADKYLRKTKSASNPFAVIKRARIVFGRPGGLH